MDHQLIAHAHLYTCMQCADGVIHYFLVEGEPLEGHISATGMRFRARWVQWTSGIEIGGPVILDIRADEERGDGLQRDHDRIPRMLGDITRESSRRPNESGAPGPI